MTNAALTQSKNRAINGLSAFMFREFFKAYFDSNLVLRCILNISGEFELLNGAWERELKIPTIELTKRKVIDFIHPDDIEATKAEFKEILKGRETKCFINRHKNIKGGYTALEWTAKLSNDKKHIFADARVVRKCITDENLPCMCSHNERNHCYRNPNNKRLKNLMQLLD